MVNEAIVLAGGLGLRLRSSIPDMPKAMAPVRNRPFLEYLLDNLIGFGIEHVILSTGYLSEKIMNHFGPKYKGVDLSYSVEDKPMGTGGAAMLAKKMAGSDLFLILNGDTLFRTDLKMMFIKHIEKEADITIALRYVDNTARYGSIVTDNNERILSFSEKKNSGKAGWVNGGVYLFRRDILNNKHMPEIFSLEKDLLPSILHNRAVYGFRDNAYFIDIGTPEDYKRAQDEL